MSQRAKDRRPASWGAATLVVVIAAVVAACDDASQGQGPAPMDPAARYNELVQARRSAEFEVLYALETDPNKDQFSWLQNSEGWRWNRVTVEGSTILVDSTIVRWDDPPLSCGWASGDGVAGDVLCEPYLGFSYVDDAINGIEFQGSIEFAGRETILGLEAECFNESQVGLERLICLSDNGIPLRLDADVALVGRGIRVRLEALELGPAPNTADIFRPLLEGVEPGESVKIESVLVEQLSLPELPILTQYFEKREAAP